MGDDISHTAGQSFVADEGGQEESSYHVEAPGAKVDTIFADGTHQYWSTWCRHGLHEKCSATYVTGEQDDLGSLATVRRNPAQCKGCGARCVCECHVQHAPL
jgi:hypothetical protein